MPNSRKPSRGIPGKNRRKELLEGKAQPKNLAESEWLRKKLRILGSNWRPETSESSRADDSRGRSRSRRQSPEGKESRGRSHSRRRSPEEAREPMRHSHSRSRLPERVGESRRRSPSRHRHDGRRSSEFRRQTHDRSRSPYERQRRRDFTRAGLTRLVEGGRTTGLPSTTMGLAHQGGQIGTMRTIRTFAMK